MDDTIRTISTDDKYGVLSVSGRTIGTDGPSPYKGRPSLSYVRGKYQNFQKNVPIDRTYRGGAEIHRAVPVASYLSWTDQYSLTCPVCDGAELLAGAALGVWCIPCEQLAYRYVDGAVERVDYVASPDCPGWAKPLRRLIGNGFPPFVLRDRELICDQCGRADLLATTCGEGAWTDYSCPQCGKWQKYMDGDQVKKFFIHRTVAIREVAPRVVGDHVDPRILARPVVLCPTCRAARVLAELTQITGGRCWPCYARTRHTTPS